MAKQVAIAAANTEVVRRLYQHLIKSFEEFAEQEVQADPTGKGLLYVNALMGCHNFYKRIILDLESRTGDTFIREVAKMTLQAALPEQQEKNDQCRQS